MKLPSLRRAKRRTGFQPVSEGRHPCLRLFSSTASWKLSLPNRQDGRFPIILTAAVCALISPVIAAPPQPQVEFTVDAANTLDAQWQGVVERTYFFQWSSDLEHWNIAPFMAHGVPTQATHSYGALSSTPTFFARLKFADIPTANPELADFDHDGLGNLAEVNLYLDPLEADTDEDGVTDGAEVTSGGNPLLAGDGDSLRSPDTDGDGIHDAAELCAGTSPLLWDSDGDGVADGSDVFPLDPSRSEFPSTTPTDLAGPLVALDAPSNAAFVSGP